MGWGTAEAGAKIAVIGRNTEKNAVAINEINDLGAVAIAVEADVRVSNDVTNMVGAVVAKWGKVNILVNNAGINIRKRPEDLLKRNGIRFLTQI